MEKYDPQSGDEASQWLEIDFGQPVVLEKVRLVPSQYPVGQTNHQLWAGDPDHNMFLVVELTRATRGGQTMEYLLPEVLPIIRSLGIVTVSSQSWVSWREIVVISRPAP